MVKIYFALALLPVAPVWAQAELFDATDARPWHMPSFLSSALNARLDALEPASGPSEASSPAISGTNVPKDIPEDTPDEDHAAGQGDPHAAEAASGEEGTAGKNPEGHAPADGKAMEKLKAESTGHMPSKDLEGNEAKETTNQLPKVIIGGKEVITYKTKTARAVSDSTPADLQGPLWKDFLEHRFSNIIPYAHDPIRGQPSAPIQVILFEDLSCGQCLPALGALDTALATYVSQTSVVHIHAPLGTLQNTNLPAFYGKVAARMGKFWEFRANLIASHASTPDTVLDALLKTGIRERDVRGLMMTESRRFYREIDADVLLGRSFAVGQPPVAFVNGIRVGVGGIPLEKFPDVLNYVSSRLAHGLEEPPL